jgi:hypothetical protein
MKSDRITTTQSVWYAPVSCLQLVVGVQCVGVACELLFAPTKNTGAIYDLLSLDLHQSELTAHRVEFVGTWIYLVAGLLIVLFPLLRAMLRYANDGPIPALPSVIWQPPLLMFLAAWCLLMAIAQTLRGGDLAQWALGEQAVRFAAPWALLMFIPTGADRSVSKAMAYDAIGWLRFAAALTFLTHGIRSLHVDPQFVELLVGSAEKLGGWELTQDRLEISLITIGAVDTTIAFAIVTLRWRIVAIFMAVWGAVEASSWIVVSGGEAYPETLLRAANIGVPFAIFLFWHCCRQIDKQPRILAR